MAEFDVKQSTARRLVLAIGSFWTVLAVAATFMLTGNLVGLMVAIAVAFVPALFWIGPVVRTFGFMHRSSGMASFRWIAANVRATGWNPRLVGVLLPIPLVVFVGIFVWLAISGGPEFSEEDLPFESGQLPPGTP